MLITISSYTEEPLNEGFDDAISVPEEPESPQHEVRSIVGKSKRELREEHDSRVYTLATDTLIKTLMTEYKKRKQHHAMPAFVKITKQKKMTGAHIRKDDVDEVIEKQQKTSLMKVCLLSVKMAENIDADDFTVKKNCRMNYSWTRR